MKATKKIKELANGMFNADLKKHPDWTKENDREQRVSYYESELTRIKNALLNGRFYASVVSVSASGMSRKIKIGYVHNNEFKIIHNEDILKLAGIGKDGRIGGCGMDMLFHAQYTLFIRLHDNYKKANYQKRMKNYNQF